jgi:hypothetical protein
MIEIVTVVEPSTRIVGKEFNLHSLKAVKDKRVLLDPKLRGERRIHHAEEVSV